MNDKALPPPNQRLISRDQLAVELERLPTLPPVAVSLLHEFSDEDDNVDTATLARHLAADQALAARVLRIANSPFYGLSGQVDSIQEAIVVLGLRAVRSLVLVSVTVDSLKALETDDDFDNNAFWHHSVGTAVCAHHLARLAGRSSDAAFTAGLLHDIGKLVLHYFYAEEYRAIAAWQTQQQCLIEDAELQFLNIDHDEAGALLSSHWGLPASITDAIARHHHPDDTEADAMANIVHVANVLAHGLGLSQGDDELVPPLSDRAWNRLGIGWPTLRQSLPRIEKDYKETCDAMLG